MTRYWIALAFAAGLLAGVWTTEPGVSCRFWWNYHHST